MAEARSAYRGLLRAISKHISSQPSNIWRQHAVQEFHRRASDQDAQAIQAAVQLAKDYARLVESVQEHKVFIH